MHFWHERVKVLVVQLCLTLCDRGILQTRILDWVAIPFSGGSSRPRDQSWVSCIAARFFIIWATREVHFWHETMLFLQKFKWTNKPTAHGTTESNNYKVRDSVQFSCSVVSNSLQPHESQHANNAEFGGCCLLNWAERLKSKKGKLLVGRTNVWKSWLKFKIQMCWQLHYRIFSTFVNDLEGRQRLQGY